MNRKKFDHVQITTLSLTSRITQSIYPFSDQMTYKNRPRFGTSIKKASQSLDRIEETLHTYASKHKLILRTFPKSRSHMQGSLQTFF